MSSNPQYVPRDPPPAVGHGPEAADAAASGDGRGASEPSARPRATGRAPRVLVVEDHEDTAEVMQLLLSVEGMDALVARDGAEGEVAARRARPTVILSDLDMPAVDGFSLAERLRADPLFAHTPLVAVTASADERSMQRARRAGFTRFLAKPVDPDYLIRTVREVLNRRRGAAPYHGPERRGRS